MKPRLKCLIIGNTPRTISNFRLPLVRWLQEKGIEVTISCIGEEGLERLRGETSAPIDYFPYDNRSASIRKTNEYGGYLKQLIRKTEPDIILTFQAKPNIFGCYAVRKLKREIPVLVMVEGLGDPFTKKSLKWRVIGLIEGFLYRRSLEAATSVFFLNSANRDAFMKKGICDGKKARIINGIGVDLQYFVATPVENASTFLFLGRFLKSKGVLDYCKAAKAVKQTLPQAKFLIAGIPFDVTEADLKPYIDAGDIEYLGPVTDTASLYKRIGTTVIPSYGEGFSVVAMESAACGRQVIATNIPGCKEAIVDGVTGSLFTPGDVGSLASLMAYCVENPEVVRQRGQAARSFAEEHFSFLKANQTYLDEISTLLCLKERGKDA